MRISIRGSDRGNALFLSVAFILILSFVFVSFVPRVINVKRAATRYKAAVLLEIQKTNADIRSRYDLN